jgi:hypothetical protein
VRYELNSYILLRMNLEESQWKITQCRGGLDSLSCNLERRMRRRGRSVPGCINGAAVFRGGGGEDRNTAVWLFRFWEPQDKQ